MNVFDNIPIEISGFSDEDLKHFEGLVPCVSATEADKSSLLFLFKRASNSEFTHNLSGINAGAIITDASIAEVSTPCPIFVRKNARELLSYAFSEYCKIDYSKLTVIGITGTNGKTTTATLVYNILSSAGVRCGFIGTGRIEICKELVSDDMYSMTTPDPNVLYPTIKKMQDEGCTHLVMEISSHSIALGKISAIPFECGIFTNLSVEHTDYHKSMSEYFEVKASFIKKCKKAIINVDDYYGAILYDQIKGAKSSIGILYKADSSAIEIKTQELSKTEFYYKEKSLIFKARINIIGVCNVYNALCAIKCAIMIGIKPCIVKFALENIKSIAGRFEIISDVVTVVIDYAHTPFALENILKTLNSAKGFGQKLYAVFGCGGNRSREKRYDMGKIAAKHSDYVIITEDNSRNESFDSISSDIVRDIADMSKITVIENRRLAIETAIKLAKEKDIIAIIGKGHEKYIIGKNGATYFNEREIIQGALKKKGTLSK